MAWVNLLSSNYKKRILHRVLSKQIRATSWQNQQNNLRPAKTQISLGVSPVWSEPSLCDLRIAKDQRLLHVDSEDSDQTERMPRLIWVFAGRTNHFVVTRLINRNDPKYLDRQVWANRADLNQTAPSIRLHHNVQIHSNLFMCPNFYSKYRVHLFFHTLPQISRKDIQKTGNFTIYLIYRNEPKFLDRQAWENSEDPDQTAPRGAVWSGSTRFAIPLHLLDALL